MAGRFARKMHRLHRWFGSALFVLLALWFASGAVMTVAPWPRFSEPERLASARALPVGDVELPSEVAAAVARGEHARLANVEGRATWLVGREAFPAPDLDAPRAQREIEARFGPVAWLERLDELDQWSVSQRLLPLFRAGFANGDQVYLAAHTGEIVQHTTSRERVLAWLGPIPHWVYFTWLRAQRELWKDTVLVLSALGMIATLTGLIAGISTARQRKRAIRDPVLRWHQGLGLGFGALAFTWLFSGALSLTPFQWTRFAPPRELLVGPAPSAAAVNAALRACGGELRELELAPLAGHTYAVCTTRDRMRIVDLASGVMQSTLPTSALPGSSLEHAPDAYFYPTHDGAPFPAAYLRLSRGDEQGTTLYVDPARARVLALHTDRTRLERWLYHGLHSLDLPGLYEHRWLWRVVIWLAMGAGFVLSALGGVMAWRRYRPRPARGLAARSR
ncbi:MAG TPA: PepSY domain-containing protein [Polyangiales bacterium]|nr:PepSY domain-containing protein [Polyangiales bacterium]